MKGYMETKKQGIVSLFVSNVLSNTHFIARSPIQTLHSLTVIEIGVLT